MTNPFEKYFPKKEGDNYFLSELYLPDVKIESEGMEATAVIRNLKFNLCGLQDLLNWKGESSPGAFGFYQGKIAERLLSIIMEDFTEKIISETGKENNVEGEVLREKTKYRVKGYVAEWNEK